MLLSHPMIILSHNQVLISYLISKLLILWLCKYRVINISRNTSTLFCKYKFVHTYITRTAFIKDLRVLIDFKLYDTVTFIVFFLNQLEFLLLVRSIAFRFRPWKFNHFIFFGCFPEFGQTVVQLFEALRYKPEVRGFDSRWCRWNFSLT